MSLLGNLFGGGSSNKTTTTTNQAPWAAAQPAMKLGLSQATKLFNADKDGSYYTGSTVTPWSSYTKQGMGQIAGLANANSGGKGMSGEYQDILNQGGYNDQQMASANAMQNMLGSSGLTGPQNTAMSGYNYAIRQGGYNAAQKAALGGLGATMKGGGYNGDMRDASNSYGSMMKNGGYNADMQEASNNYGSMMDAGGYNGAMKGALSGYQGIAQNPYNKEQQGAINNTTSVANSRFDLNSNPAFMDVLKQAQGAARDSVNMSAGGAGRYGGGVHQGNLASEVGDLTSRMVGSEYQNWQGRKDAANANLFGMGQTGVNTQMGANSAIGGLGQTAYGNMANATAGLGNLGQTAYGNRANATAGLGNLGQTAYGNMSNAQNSMFNMGQTGQSNVANAQGSLANLGQTGIANRMNAGNNLFQMGQGALGNIGTAYNGMQQPAQNLMQLGSMNEDLATRQKNDLLRRFNERQQAPWDQIARLNSVASGAGQMGGTTTQSQPGQNPFLTAMGYGATALGGLGQFI